MLLKVLFDIILSFPLSSDEWSQANSRSLVVIWEFAFFEKDKAHALLLNCSTPHGVYLWNEF